MAQFAPGTKFGKNYDWETPDQVFEYLNAEFSFDLDAAASDECHKCDEYFTEEQDGLKQIWHGTVWCNPPYGRQVGKWVKKASEYKGTTVMLLPARTDTMWWHKYVIGKADEVRFLCGRLRFAGATSNAPFASAIVIFNKKRPCYRAVMTTDIMR